MIERLRALIRTPTAGLAIGLFAVLAGTKLLQDTAAELGGRVAKLTTEADTLANRRTQIGLDIAAKSAQLRELAARVAEREAELNGAAITVVVGED